MCKGPTESHLSFTLTVKRASSAHRWLLYLVVSRLWCWGIATGFGGPPICQVNAPAIAVLPIPISQEG